jgi:hypothetical protein
MVYRAIRKLLFAQKLGAIVMDDAWHQLWQLRLVMAMHSCANRVKLFGSLKAP